MLTPIRGMETRRFYVLSLIFCYISLYNPPRRTPKWKLAWATRGKAYEATPGKAPGGAPGKALERAPGRAPGVYPGRAPGRLGSSRAGSWVSSW